MEVAIAQNTQPRQSPTVTPPKPLIKTPITPTDSEIEASESSTIRALQLFQITPTTPVTDANEIDPEQAEKADKLSLKNEQNPQPRQTPTVTPPKPLDKTPTTPTNDEGQEEQILEAPAVKPSQPNKVTPTKPTTPVTDSDDIDPEQAEAEADQVSPKNQQNPFTRPDIDKLLTDQFNDDMWRIMKGALPCLEISANCLNQLQTKAVTGSVLLRELDNRIQEANDKIAEAKARNAKTVRLSILTPALQYLLGPAPQPGQPQQGNGLIDNLVGIFSGKTGILNGLLNVIGIPLFKGSQGANEEANRNAIAISDPAN